MCTLPLYFGEQESYPERACNSVVTFLKVTENKASLYQTEAINNNCLKTEKTTNEKEESLRIILNLNGLDFVITLHYKQV